MSEAPASYDIKQFTLRLPTNLHAKVFKASNTRSKPSITDEIIERLEGSFKPATAVHKLLVNLDLPRVARLTSVGNTTGDVERLLQLAAVLNVERWIFAARADELNGAVMVIYAEAQGSQPVMVHDHSYINMARRPRMLDVQQLMQGLNELGVLKAAEFCPKLIPDTRELTPAEAAAAIVGAGPKEFDPLPYLKLLAQHDAFDVAEFSNKASFAKHKKAVARIAPKRK